VVLTREEAQQQVERADHGSLASIGPGLLFVEALSLVHKRDYGSSNHFVQSIKGPKATFRESEDPRPAHLSGSQPRTR
jgi:hypothetical protein